MRVATVPRRAASAGEVVTRLKRRVASRPRVESMRFDLGTFRFQASTDVPAIARRLASLMRPDDGCDGCPGVAGYMIRKIPLGFELERDGARILRARAIEPVIDRLIVDVTRRAVDVSPHVCVHAGVVSSEGRGVLIAGDPGAGKSTLTTALVRAGFDYLSDEVAALDVERPRVHPVHRPIVLERAARGSFPELGERAGPGRLHVAPDEIRSGSIGGPCDVRLIVLRRFVPDRPTELRRLSRAEAVLALGRNVFQLDRLGERGVRALARVAGEAPAMEIVGGELRRAVASIEGLLADATGDDVRTTPTPATPARRT